MRHLRADVLVQLARQGVRVGDPAEGVDHVPWHRSVRDTIDGITCNANICSVQLQTMTSSLRNVADVIVPRIYIWFECKD